MIEAKAKVGLLPSPFVRDIDQCFLQGNCPVIMSKSQVSSARDPCDELSLEKALPSNKPPYSLRSENGNISNKKAWKEKKKKQHCRDAKQAGKGPTSATDVNASGTANKTHPRCKDHSMITCYNCNKKDLHANHCSEPRKNTSKN